MWCGRSGTACPTLGRILNGGGGGPKLSCVRTYRDAWPISTVCIEETLWLRHGCRKGRVGDECDSQHLEVAQPQATASVAAAAGHRFGPGRLYLARHSFCGAFFCGPWRSLARSSHRVVVAALRLSGI